MNRALVNGALFHQREVSAALFQIMSAKRAALTVFHEERKKSAKKLFKKIIFFFAA